MNVFQFGLLLFGGNPVCDVVYACGIVGCHRKRLQCRSRFRLGGCFLIFYMRVIVIRVLLVCTGNICRSPIAEAVLKALALRAGLNGRVEFDSAGTSSGHAGERADERARKVAAGRGYDLGRFRARPVVEKDFRRFDLILAMDRGNLSELQQRCPEEFKGKISLFLPYAGIQPDEEVPDPYYSSMVGFERVLDLCEAAGHRLVRVFLRV